MTLLKHVLVGFLSVMLSILSIPAHALSITTYEWFGPVNFSPSLVDARMNALIAVMQGLLSAGTPGTPTFFISDDAAGANEIVTTSFPSWNGDASPPAPYQSEGGQAMHVALFVDGEGTSFHPGSVYASGASTGADPLGMFGSPFYSLGSLSSLNAIGVDYGSDGVFGGGNDIFFSSGNPPVDGLFVGSIGTFTGLQGYCDPFCSEQERQVVIDSVLSQYGDPFQYRVDVSVRDGRGILGSDTATFYINQSPPVAVPEPGTLALLGAGLVGMTAFTRRKDRATTST